MESGFVNWEVFIFLLAFRRNHLAIPVKKYVLRQKLVLVLLYLSVSTGLDQLLCRNSWPCSLEKQ